MSQQSWNQLSVVFTCLFYCVKLKSLQEKWPQYQCVTCSNKALCSVIPSANRYKMSLLKPSTKALALSCKVSVRTDNRGFLSLQYLVRNDDGQICFVEYYCCPDEDVEED